VSALCGSLWPKTGYTCRLPVLHGGPHKNGMSEWWEADPTPNVGSARLAAEAAARDFTPCAASVADEDDGQVVYRCALAIGHFGTHRDPFGLCDWPNEHEGPLPPPDKQTRHPSPEGTIDGGYDAGPVRDDR
jgi:hypothetical protein